MLSSVQPGLSSDYSAAHLHAFERPSFVFKKLFRTENVPLSECRVFFFPLK